MHVMALFSVFMIPRGVISQLHSAHGGARGVRGQGKQLVPRVGRSLSPDTQRFYFARISLVTVSECLRHIHKHFQVRCRSE